MSTHGYTHHTAGGTGGRVDLHDPAAIPVPAVADIYSKLGGVERLVSQTMRERDSLDDRIRDLINGAPGKKLGERLWNGESIEDDATGVAESVESLRIERAAVQARIDGYTEAARIGHDALGRVLDESAPALAKALIAKARTLPAKLATAVEIVERVAAAHDSALGLAHLLEDRAAGSPSLVYRHVVEGPGIALGLAAQHLREAIGQLTNEIEAASGALSVPEKRKARKSHPAPVEPPTPTQAAPAAPSAPEAMAFEIGEDTDDDDA